MEKKIALFMLIIILSILTSCNETDIAEKIQIGMLKSNEKSPLSTVEITEQHEETDETDINILPETTKISVTHYISGQEEKWIIEDMTEIERIFNWLNTLTLKLKHYEEGNSPGDADGGEVYWFSSDSDEFSYYKGGTKDCHIIYKSEWYKVGNPTDPFVD